MALLPLAKKLIKPISQDPAMPASKMTEVIDTLPEDFVMKSESVPNYLARRGIKPEELTTSGLHQKLAEGGVKRLSKADLLGMDQNRADKLSRTKSTQTTTSSTVPNSNVALEDVPLGSRYGNITTDVGTVGAKDNYAEDIIRFDDSKPRRVMSHYDQDIPNYAMHARTSTGVLNGKNTRVVQELQSDLFQKRRAFRNAPSNSSSHRTTVFDQINRDPRIIELNNQEQILTNNPLGYKDDAGRKLTAMGDERRKLEAEITAQARIDIKSGKLSHKRLPSAPFEKNWLSRNIDYQIFQAGSEGQEAIAVPLTNVTGTLARSAGVGDWYKTQVRATMKKRVQALNNQLRLDNPKAKGDELFRYVETEQAVDQSVSKLKADHQNAADSIESFLSANNLTADVDIDEIDPILAEQLIDLFSAMGVAEELLERATGDLAVDSVAQIIFPARSTNTISLADLEQRYTELLEANNLPMQDAYDLDYNFNGTVQTGKLGELQEIAKHLVSVDQGGSTDLAPTWLNNIKLYSQAGAVATAGALLGSNEAEASPMMQVISSGSKATVRASSADKLTSSEPVIADRPQGITTLAERNTFAPATVTLKIDAALMQGAPPAELIPFVANDQGVSEDVATKWVDQALQSKVLKSLDSPTGPLAQELAEFLTGEQGVDPERVKAIMPSNDVLNRYWNGVGSVAIDTWAAMNAPKTPEQIISRSKNTHMKYSELATLGGSYVTSGNWSQELQHAAAEDAHAEGLYIIDVLATNGIKAELGDDGDVYYEDKTGELKLAETSFVDEIFAGRSEMAYALAGGISASIAMPGPWWAKVAAGTIASATGAAAGRGEDVVRNALQTKMKIETKLVWERMVDAGMADVVIGVLGSAVFAGGKYTAKKIYNILDTMAGNKEGAYRALKDALPGLDDDKAKELISEWERINQRKAPGRRLASKALNIIPRTSELADPIIAHAVGVEATASKNLVTEIDARAADLIAAVNSKSTDDIGRIATVGLNDYERKVKDYYGSIKEMAKLETENTSYAFDYDALALEPLRSVTEHLTNGELQKRALSTFIKIQKLGGQNVAVSDTVTAGMMVPTNDVPVLRTFENLLELNVEVNKFRRMGWVKKQADQTIVANIQANVRAEVEKVARTYLSNPDEWLVAWKRANTEYGKMARLKENVLVKALRKGAMSTEEGSKALMKYAKSDDATFRNVIDSLNITNPKLVSLTENSILKGYISKSTSGTETSVQVIDFIKLNTELKNVRLISPEARELKRTISEFAKVFRNDPALARASGGFNLPSISQSLSTDPREKFKYAASTGIFRQLQKYKPTQVGRKAALVDQVGKSLANPLSTRATKDIMKYLPKDPAFENQLASQLLELGKFGVRSDFPEVEIYRVAKTGASNSKTNGALGKGVYYTTKKRTGLATGSSQSSLKIDPRDIVDEAMIREMLGVQDVTREMIRNNTTLQDDLLSQGKKGIIINNQIILFNH